MNVQLKDITVTARDGRVSHLEQVYIRGSHVRFFIVPDMLRYAAPNTPTAVFRDILRHSFCPVQDGTTDHDFSHQIGMPRCSSLETLVDVVLVWQEVAQQSAGR